jgi:hypothetical protein
MNHELIARGHADYNQRTFAIRLKHGTTVYHRAKWRETLTKE